MSGAGSAAPTKAGTNVPADVASMLAEGAKIPEAKAESTEAQKAVAAGDDTSMKVLKLEREPGDDAPVCSPAASFRPGRARKFPCTSPAASMRAEAAGEGLESGDPDV